MNGHATVEINHLISQIQLFHLIITVFFIMLFLFKVDHFKAKERAIDRVSRHINHYNALHLA